MRNNQELTWHPCKDRKRPNSKRLRCPFFPFQPSNESRRRFSDLRATTSGSRNRWRREAREGVNDGREIQIQALGCRSECSRTFARSNSKSCICPCVSRSETFGSVHRHFCTWKQFLLQGNPWLETNKKKEGKIEMIFFFVFFGLFCLVDEPMILSVM